MGVLCDSPTVALRLGPPNADNSSFISSIIREPVAGQTAICPVSIDLPIALISLQKLAEAIVAVDDARSEGIGWPRTITMPAVQATVKTMLAALREQQGDETADRVHFERNEKIESTVKSWPASIQSARA